MKRIIAAIALSTCVASPAVAAGFDQKNLYAGAQLTSNSCSGCTSSSGFGVLVGYTIDKQWAVEGSYSSFGSNVSGMGAHGVFSYPIQNQVKAIGKIGFASVTVDVPGYSGIVGFDPVTGFPVYGTIGGGSVSKSGLSYGIGGEYEVNKQVGIRGGVDFYAIEGSTLNSLYVGGVYKF